MESHILLTINDLPLDSLDTHFSLNFDNIHLIELKHYVNRYIYIWTHYFGLIKRKGFGLNLLQDALTFLAFIRFLTLVIRYNIVTAFACTAISVFAGCIWYQKFVKILHAYTSALYKHDITLRMGMDGAEAADIRFSRMRRRDYQVRLTNPVGIIAYALVRAITDGSVARPGTGYGDDVIFHYIDPLSMFVGALDCLFHDTKIARGSIWCYYTLVCRILPVVIYWGKAYYLFVINSCAYTYIVRVKKEYCPYFIRWYWTLHLTFSYFETYLVEFIYRINSYIVNEIDEPIAWAARMSREYGYHGLYQSKYLEGELMENTVMFFIICHLAFYVYVMLHAFSGQYMYIPLFTRNTEVHIGLRDPKSPYSGGNTAWQTEELPKYAWIPKFWYGWFGRGSKAPNVIFVAIKYLIYKPIFYIVKAVLKIFRRKK